MLKGVLFVVLFVSLFLIKGGSNYHVGNVESRLSKIPNRQRNLN